jgi:hypothetical protein
MGLFDIFGTSDQDAAAQAQIQGLTQAQQQGTSDINNGLSQATSSLTSALAPFATNLATNQAGQTAYANATGANGAAGYAAALNNFQTNPGYQFTLNQGTENVLRNQAKTGALNSGNTDVALDNYTTGLANNTWQQYLTNLQPFLQGSTAAAAGTAGVDTSLAQTQSAAGNNLASLDYSTNTGIGNANANADLAGLSASGNLVNLLTSFL